MPRVALLVIDMQVGLLRDSRWPVLDAGTLIGRVAELIARARAACVPVVFVQHNDEPGSPLEHGALGWALHPELGWKADDAVVQKSTPDAFLRTPLQELLQQQQIGRLIVCGLQSEYCIDTTVRRAFSLGYETVLVKDGHSTCDSAGLGAAQIVAHENRVLGSWFSRLQAADEVDFH